MEHFFRITSSKKFSSPSGLMRITMFQKKNIFFFLVGYTHHFETDSPSHLQKKVIMSDN